ncbi:MAG: DNA polymerase III subunit gamma/tau [SAR324 cluster bacterium]|jgi:DNA polymerase-3 subunit gamma/tau|nr:DNA polymerase III subunit gamma/tau [SAR324 cluster bacterium]|tara:strand:+ start:6102 stop:8093 length:1992 start_codon:yes stop_codon:yes gene_type:complete
MSYVVLARKLRPACFGDLIGQEIAAQTLRNAVISDRVAHAFLFSGSRGVGKTSAARILTRALNCLNPDNGDPCNTCVNCHEINQNASPDVYEIDAASNRGIENIRELRENVNYVPASCRYKVYIIDEAHMLTLESFNALLKTLEEPPSHVKFIFATTDPYKIPPTIISRCQRYDFLRIPIKKMADFLETVVAKENLEITRQALEMIARNSVGGMRDALTSIDQILSFTDTYATDQKVAQILGILDRESRFAFIEAILKKNEAEALQFFQKLQEHGHDVNDILSDLLQTVKTVSIVQTIGKNTALFQELSYDDLEAFESLGKLAGTDELQQIFHVLLDLEEQMKLSAHAKICFEMAILQISSVEPLIGIPEIISEIKNIRGVKSDSDMLVKQPETDKKSSEEKGPKESEPELFKQQSALDMSVEQKPPMDASVMKNILQPEKIGLPGKKLEGKDIDVPEPQIQGMHGYSEEKSNVSDLDEQKVHVEKSEVLQGDNSDEDKLKHEVPVENQNFVSGADEQRHPENKQNSEILHEKPPEEWCKFSEEIKKSSSKLASIVRNAVPQSLDAPDLKLVFKSGNYATMLTQESIKLLENIASEISGHSVKLICEDSNVATSQKTIAEYDQLLIEQEKEQKRKKAKEFPLVKDILSVFKNSKITSIELSDA